jgi:predicted MPP superfamily phosphohydrolase
MIHRIVDWLRLERGQRRKSRRWARWIGRSWAHVAYGYRVEPTWLELNQHDVAISGLPDSFAGFRIVQLSDFHCSRKVTPAYLAEAVDLAQAQDPDLVVLTGDFVHRGYKYVNAVAEALSRLAAPHGILAVLGNHDFSVRNALGLRRYRHLHRAITHALTDRGIQVLKNEAVVIRKGEASLYLVGVQDLWSRDCDVELAFEGLSPYIPRVVLAHNPRTVEHLQGRRCDLMLSGHTHGGQINLPRFGRPTLSKKAKRLAAGMYRLHDTHVYVNKGVGFGFPFRYGARPEVAAFTLRSA